MKVAIIVNTSKPKAIECAKSISQILSENGVEILAGKADKDIFNTHVTVCDNHFELFKGCDFAVTVGGDGTIIHSAKHAATYDKPMIGVNVGRVGFVAEIEPDNISDITRILDGKYEIQRRMLLEVSVEKSDGSVQSFIAVNDATIARGQLSRIIDISLDLDSSHMTDYRADGILFSTPTGSTAYSLSAGGPVVFPEMECILVTPICPHSLVSRSVLFDSSAVLKSTVKTPDGTSALLSIDGEKNIELNSSDVITVKKSPYTLKLLKLYDRNFYKILGDKLKERNA